MKDVAELQANQKVNVKATLSKGIDCPKAIEIKAQNKIMLVKEDCILEDCTGTAPFHIWGSLIEELFDGCSYEFFNLCVKQFQSSVYLATSINTSFKEVEQQVEILQGPSLFVNVEKQITVKQFDSVKKLSIFVSCQFCKRKITEILADDSYVKCENQSCGARQRKIDCKTDASVQLLANLPELGAVWLTALTEVIEMLLNNSSVSLLFSDCDTIEEHFLSGKDIEFTYRVEKKIITKITSCSLI